MLKEAYRAKSQPLAEDYVKDERTAKERFDYSPWKAEDWEARADWVLNGGYPRSDRAGISRILKLYNEEMGNTSPAAARSAELLSDAGTLVVAGGQQAGLFTGPLLVIHKAVTIIRLAREASERLKRPVVPVFWIAGEDHDFDEVNHWYAARPEGGVERWRLEHPTGVRTSISRLAVPSWEEALTKMDEWLQPSDFKPELLQHLHQYARESGTLTEFFARIMAWLFGRHGLLLLDSDDPRLRREEAPMFSRLLEHHETLNKRFLEGADRVRSLGYAPQADQAEGNVNLFVYDDRGERVLLQAADGVYTDRKLSLRLDGETLRQWIAREPERFSNNVMTRPIMQDYLLPVLATVLGPGEIAYWALTKEAFHELGMRMPIVAPRLEFTLVEGAIRKNMEKFGLDFTMAVDHYDAFRSEWLAGQGQQEIEELFADVRRRFGELYAPVVERVSGLNPGLAKLAETNRQKIAEQIDFLQAKAADAVESQFATGLRQLDRIRLSLAPLSKPQERVYNVFAYLNKYGSAWLDELIDTPYAYDGGHRLVYL
ncbi:bacillithiol biosynthesis cysteine-adding enzyme BshC [Gorillibacterium sp. sgz5001074]|uniref:bacillithiol biosynthesis cysteine-adding enzyme BshC n=1 Tax=Gorillibacterium sp. sgz5001074 TaxID=3446695 RepID=UPI003F66F546